MHERYLADRRNMPDLSGGRTVGELVASHARTAPDATAFITGDARTTWAEYDATADAAAASLAGLLLPPGARVGVLMPDGPAVHAVYVAAERLGLVVVGISPRAGSQEAAHVLRVARARAVVTLEEHAGAPAAELVAAARAAGCDGMAHVVLQRDVARPATVDGGALRAVSRQHLRALTGGRRLRVDDVFLVNATSGTTGVPKCVVHDQARWLYFGHLAIEAGELVPDDIVMSVVPTPYGFGLWTSHMTPALLGCPVVLTERFTPEGTLALLERERVSMLACVTTQFVMMLNVPDIRGRHLTSLRCMFTGGEAVPYERSAEFEDVTGASVLQFYGSNETGAVSRTRHFDTREQRLRTAGRVVDEMQVRLLDEHGRDVTSSGGPGQAACRGPATCLGYDADEEANRALLTDDGWMRTGDICTIDAGGYLTVVGRAADVIIRGGKNISTLVVEEEVGRHDAVATVAVVPVPDPVFGERVCAYVALKPGRTLNLEQLRDFLRDRGASREVWPERLVVLPELPESAGGKVAKAELRADARRRAETGAAQPT